MSISRSNENSLRSSGGDDIANLAVALDKNPAFDGASRTFEELATNDIMFKSGGALKALNEQLRSDPELAKKIAAADPAKINRALPQMFADPKSAPQLVAAATPARPAVAAAQADTPAATGTSAGAVPVTPSDATGSRPVAANPLMSSIMGLFGGGGRSAASYFDGNSGGGIMGFLRTLIMALFGGGLGTAMAANAPAQTTPAAANVAANTSADKPAGPGEAPKPVSTPSQYSKPDYSLTGGTTGLVAATDGERPAAPKLPVSGGYGDEKTAPSGQVQVSYTPGLSGPGLKDLSLYTDLTKPLPASTPTLVASGPKPSAPS